MEVSRCPVNFPLNQSNDMYSTGHLKLDVICLIGCYGCIMMYIEGVGDTLLYLDVCVCVEYCPIMSNIGNEWECTFENDRTTCRKKISPYLPTRDFHKMT